MKTEQQTLGDTASQNNDRIDLRTSNKQIP